MQPQLIIKNNEISLRIKNEIYIIPPFFYCFQDQMSVGKQAEQAIDLYAEYIFNIFEETDSNRIQLFLLSIHEYIRTTFSIRTYEVQIEKWLSRIYEAARSLNPKVKLMTMDKSSAEKPPAPWDKDVHDGLAVVIAYQVIRSSHLSNTLFTKIKRIVRLKVERYMKDLIMFGETIIELKVVDDEHSVRVIQTVVSTGIPAILKLMDVIKNPSRPVERLAKALYLTYENQFKVTLISPFSFGKSTLINGLLGQNMLNMDIRAETAIVTKVVSAEDNRLFVKYSDNRIQMNTYHDELELNAKLQALTSVRSTETPSEVQIHYVAGSLPGITIIDAPGLNSRHAEHNSKATDAFEMSDLILFLINPTHIGEAHFVHQMKEFQESIKQSGKQYAYVLSKLDLHSDDYEVILSEMEIVLKDLDPTYCTDQVFFVSGLFALYGKLLKNDKIDLIDVRKSRGIYILDNDEVISGRRIEKHHAASLLTSSQIEPLEYFIRQRSENAAHNKLDLDCRKQQAI
ncbi:dynamin family protein [Paenibacillus odorifer]|uniref:dynamin family protein n=1 Tax=Paenibacillus odorifer TaxID=189426 RepID=UPI00096FF73E|nr:dynamin family protein [Paenibacillus odorifer]OMD92791.1 hypothetical protein BSK67_18690 [Paenibacillus odorifer]